MPSTLTDFSRLAAYVDNIALTAAVSKTVTKPATYRGCVITPSADTWVKRTAPAVAGIADTVDGSASIYLPAKVPRYIDLTTPAASGETVLGTFALISTAGGNCTLEWFQ